MSLNGSAAEANGGDSSAGGSPVGLRDVDLGERTEPGAATTSSAAATTVRMHGHGAISQESYFGARWGAFKRKALIRRPAGSPEGPASNNANDSESGLGGGDSSPPDSPASGSKEVAMKKVLGAGDLIMFGIGGIVGAGVFVLTGVGAHDAAGPAIIVSYLIASFAAALSALCYTEFAVDMPIAGGAFNYVAVECGEFFGWISGWNLVLEYTLSCAAVGRGFSSYASTMCGMDPDSWRMEAGIFSLDFPGLLLVMAIAALLCYGTKESANFNTAITAVNIAVILFVVFVGAPEISISDFKPFAPKGVTGIFNGAAIVFFSYVGFDTVATTAEETRNPSRDLPIGIVGSLAICTLLYAAMCAALTGMVYYADIDVNAPFADAFEKIGMGWATEIVSIGAVTGIVTALLVSLMGCARIYTILGRTGLLPPYMSRISRSRGTPANATVVTGISAGLLTFLFDIEILAELVSIGTLFVFSFVAGSILVKHYGQEISGRSNIPGLVVRMAVQSLLSIGLCLCVMDEKWMGVLALSAIFLVVTASYYVIPRKKFDLKFAVPMVPIVPSLCILFNVYLISSLGVWAYVRFFIWNFVGLCVYFFYGVMHTREPTSEELSGQTYRKTRGGIALMDIKRDSLREDTVLLSGERSA